MAAGRGWVSQSWSRAGGWVLPWDSEAGAHFELRLSIIRTNGVIIPERKANEEAVL